MAKSPELLMALFDRGASPNAADTEGNTLLHTTDSPELMAALLTRGGDPNVTNKVRGLLLSISFIHAVHPRPQHPPSLNRV